MVEYAEVLGIFTSLLATVITFHDKKLLKQLRKAKALDVSTAIAFSNLNKLQSSRLRRSVSRGDIMQSTEGRYFLDEVNFSINTRRRRRRALTFALIAVALVLVLFFGLK